MGSWVKAQGTVSKGLQKLLGIRNWDWGCSSVLGCVPITGEDLGSITRNKKLKILNWNGGWGAGRRPEAR
jgi:hypothetical protein